MIEPDGLKVVIFCGGRGLRIRDFPEPARYAGISMCVVFLLGLFALPFAPETKDQPLPE